MSNGLEASKDALLSYLIHLVHRDGLSVNISVAVAGCVVTGSLVPRHVWAQAVLEQLGGLDAGSRFVETLDELSRDAATRPETMEPGEGQRYEFVHLVDARYLSGNRLVPSEAGMPWRGVFADVSGWSLGQLGEVA